MGMTNLSAALLSAAVFCNGAMAALDPIVMKGTKFFFSSSGQQFYIKGVAYQQEVGAGGSGSSAGNQYVDPLADLTKCTRDVKVLKDLGTNVIRTYAIDPTKDHSGCMALLDAAGIYVISDLSEPQTSIIRDTPKWDVDLFDRYKAVVDELGKYSNVIGFFAGNEVTNNRTNTQASAFVKAAVRDTKAYIKKNKSRWMGVGYAANDDADIRANIAHYFNCGDNQDEAIDYWGYNIYEWCGDNTFQGSGYSAQVDFFRNYSVPVFFAEYGCNKPTADSRIWQETVALYSNQMTDVMSGGIVYMYFEEANDYGLVSVVGNSVSTMTNALRLKTTLAAVSPASTSMASYKPSNVPAACPPVGADWQAAALLPPTPDRGLCECMFNSLACVPSKSVTPAGYGTIFGYICGQVPSACAGISASTAKGVYGAYGMCTSEQQLGYVLDQYYKSQKNSPGACAFSGNATIVQPSAAASCSSALGQAAASNSFAATASTGTPSATGGSGGKNAAGALDMTRVMTLGDFAMGLYVLVAMGLGAGMIVM